MRVVVKIMAPFGVPMIIRHLLFRVPKKVTFMRPQDIAVLAAAGTATRSLAAPDGSLLVPARLGSVVWGHRNCVLVAEGSFKGLL